MSDYNTQGFWDEEAAAFWDELGPIAVEIFHEAGASGAEALVGLVPFAWIAGIVVFVIAGAFLLAKGLKL